MKRTLFLMPLLAACATGPVPQGFLVLNVKPAEARIVLDDRYIGSAEQLSGHRLRLGVGRRRLEVSAEGHYTARREADVKLKQKTELQIELHAIPEGEHD